MADTQPLIIFSHGKDGRPDGSKIKRLMVVAASHGCRVESLDYRTIPNPDQRADSLLQKLSNPPTPLVLVGSSMGAYISIIASQQIEPRGLFLLAPAIYLEGYKNQAPTPKAELTTIIHGWHDEVVPVASALAFAQQHQTRLHVVDSDHRLLTAMPFIENIFALFLDELLNAQSW